MMDFALRCSSMSGENMNVLVVEDESSIRRFITINLTRSQFQVFEAPSGEEALSMLETVKPAVVVLDVMLPGMDGFEVCQKIRESGMDTVVIMLTARGQDMDKIMGLELGADDYMVKPFNPLELVARIRAVMRRSGQFKDARQEQEPSGGILLDEKSKKVFKNGAEIELTPREYAIVRMFMQNAGTALSKDDILNAIWGVNYFGDINTVNVHIRRLREKIEEDPSDPKQLETVWGYGYRWRKEDTK